MLDVGNPGLLRVDVWTRSVFVVGRPVHSRVFRSIPGLWELQHLSIVTTKNVSGYSEVSTGGGDTFFFKCTKKHVLCNIWDILTLDNYSLFI